jgi:ubiquitin-small subunit ribosomal protein S27Ae
MLWVCSVVVGSPTIVNDHGPNRVSLSLSPEKEEPRRRQGFVPGDEEDGRPLSRPHALELTHPLSNSRLIVRYDT